MKNLTTKILIVTFIMAHSVAKAQFKEGESFLGGSFYLDLYDTKPKDIDSHLKTYSHNIGLSIGKFKSSTRAAGWSLDHALGIQNYEGYNIDPKPLQRLRFGISRFWEFYKPLNDKFALYVSPNVGLSYTLGNSFEVASDKIVQETHDNSFMLNLSAGAGIAWRVAPKWAIYGGFAFVNPLYLSYGFGYQVNKSNPRPDGQYPQSNSRGFVYRFTPELSSGSIGLGFRYFY